MVERLAIFYSLLAFNADATRLEWYAFELPMEAIWVDEMQQWQSAGIRLPPSSPAAAWQLHARTAKLGATLVRLCRRHFIVLYLGCEATIAPDDHEDPEAHPHVRIRRLSTLECVGDRFCVLLAFFSSLLSTLACRVAANMAQMPIWSALKSRATTNAVARGASGCPCLRPLRLLDFHRRLVMSMAMGPLGLAIW